MSMPANPREAPRRSGRSLWFAATAVLGLLVVAAGVAGALWYRGRPPEVPAIDLSGADPALQQEVEAAREAVRKAPRSGRAWGRLGMILAAHRLNEESMMPLGEAERLDPGNPRWPYHQALVLLLANPDAARAKLERAVARCGNRPDAPRLKLAELLLGQDRDDEAEQQFRLLLRDDAGNARAHLGLARLAFERNGPNDLQTALDHLEFALAGPCTRKAAHVLRAQFFQRRGDVEAAARDERLAAALPPDRNWPDPYMDEGTQLRVGEYVRFVHGSQLLDGGQIAEAADFVRQTLQAYPRSARNWILLGRACLAANDFQGAESALRQAVEYSPESADAHVNLGIAQMNLDRPREAEKSLERATGLKADYAFAWHQLGLCLEKQGQKERALQAFDRALHCNPDFGAAREGRDRLVRSSKP